MQSPRSTAAGDGMPAVTTFVGRDGFSMSVVSLPPQRVGAPPATLPPPTPRPIRRASIPSNLRRITEQAPPRAPQAPPRRVFDFVRQAEHRAAIQRARARSAGPRFHPTPAAAWAAEEDEEGEGGMDTGNDDAATTATTFTALPGTPPMRRARPSSSTMPAMRREATSPEPPPQHLPAVRQRARPSVVVVNGHHDYVNYRHTQQGVSPKPRAHVAHTKGCARTGAWGDFTPGDSTSTETVDAAALRTRLQKLRDSLPHRSSPHMTRRLRQRRSALGGPADKRDAATGGGVHCWLGPRHTA